jgi:hypothetical protein
LGFLDKVSKSGQADKQTSGQVDGRTGGYGLIKCSGKHEINKIVNNFF